jgi:two-component system, sensor histidine kinase and response regulator
MATILVVDDDVYLREGMRDILELSNHTVLLARDGLDALDVLRAQTHPPAVIISDILMPRMNGYDLFRSVRANESWKKVPFIFLTGKSEQEDIRQGRELGVQNYVIKPFDADALLVAVEAELR